MRRQGMCTSSASQCGDRTHGDSNRGLREPEVEEYRGLTGAELSSATAAEMLRVYSSIWEREEGSHRGSTHCSSSAAAASCSPGLLSLSVSRGTSCPKVSSSRDCV